jgi:hypothetical protein
MRMARSKDQERILGLMDQFIKATGLITVLMVLVSINGKMDESIMETGTTMICMAWASIFTLMESPTKDSTKKTRKLDMAFISGLTEGSTRGGGIMASNMVLESTKTPAKAKLNMVCGNTERELHGLTLKLFTRLTTTNTLMKLSLKKHRVKTTLSHTLPFRDQMTSTKKLKILKSHSNCNRHERSNQ